MRGLAIQDIQVPYALPSPEDVSQPELLPFVQVHPKAALDHDEDARLAVFPAAEQHLPWLHLDLQQVCPGSSLRPNASEAENKPL